ncbi:MAG: hypothetical protein H6807_14675 [Planctomycetes bacterium]|nr:hypothetical protein [Planctomycetota bacterium]
MSKLLLALVVLATLLNPCVAQVKARKTSRITEGEVRLERRITPYEKDEQAFMDEYVKATMSFEFATRDDMEGVHNDWDVCLQGRGIERSPFHFCVRTVVDDDSQLWHLGQVPLEKVSPRSPRPSISRPLYDDSPDDNYLAIVGHSYLVHTVDSDSDLWAAFTVTSIEPGRAVTIRWRLLGEPKKFKPREIEKRRADVQARLEALQAPSKVKTRP